MNTPLQRACALIFIAAILPSCGRFGFSDDAVQALPISDEDALVGCNSALVADPAGTGYAVVWHEYPAPGGDEHSLMFGHLYVNEVMDGLPMVVDRLSSEPNAMWLFARANGYTVFYQRSDDLYVDQLDATGQLQTSEYLGEHPETPVVVQTDAGFGVFFEVDHELYFTRLDAQGVEAAPAVLVPITPNIDGYPVLEHPSVVHTATGYHVVYEHSWGSGLGYAHVDEDGGIISEAVFDFGGHRYPQIATDEDGRMAVTWFEGEQLIEYGMDENGNALWGGVRQLVPMNRQESLTRDMSGGPGSVAMVWESDVDDLLPQIKFRYFGLDSVEPAGAETISNTRFGFDCPHIAAGDGHFGIAFRGQVEGSQQLYVRVRHDR